MKVAFDVDGVFTDLENFQLNYGKKFFKDVKEEEINKYEIDIKEIFNCTKDEREKFWIKYIWKYCFMPFEKGFGALTKKLKDEGDDIYIITGRAHTTESGLLGKLFRLMLLHMLKKENIAYDHIFFCSEENSAEEKREICQKNGIEVIIDDKKENIEFISQVTNVICRDRIYNRDNFKKEVPRVKNTNQIYNEIRKLKYQKTFRKMHHDEIANLTDAEKEVYFQELYNYYQNLPFDDNMYEATEKNYIRLSKCALPLYNFFAEPTVFNRENVPNQNGLLFVSNHNNYYDQFPIISAIGDHRPIHFLTATKMLNMKRGIIYLKTGAVSIDREDKDDREFSKDEVTKLLVHDKNIFIFPEGRTNRGEDFLLPFQPGAVSIAQASKSLIVPMAVNFSFNNKREQIVRFGEPFRVSPLDDVLEVNEELMRKVGLLKQENEKYIESKKVYKKSI